MKSQTDLLAVGIREIKHMKTHLFLLVQTLVGLALTAIQSQAQSIYEPYTFSTLAGYSGYGSADGTGSAAQFHNPSGVAVDSVGNVYVADRWNHTIRKVTSAGVVTTLAGLLFQLPVDGNLLGDSRDGTGSDAQFAYPSGVAVDVVGNVYVADRTTIRKVTPAGVVTTLAGLAGSYGSADGTGSAAQFSGASGVALDSAGNIYVADEYNHTIRKITPVGTNWVVTTLAGSAGSSGNRDGTASDARFDSPEGVAVDNAGNVYVADRATIRKVTPAGVVTTLAGKAGADPGSADGTGSAAVFGWCGGGCGVSGPTGLAVDNLGNVYVADLWNNAIRKVTPEGAVTTLAGLAVSYGSADGTGSGARFWGPSGVAVDSAGNVYVADSNVYVADTGNNTIRKGYPALAITSSGSKLGFSGGHFGFDLAGGPPGKAVVVEGSTDLVSWLPLWTNALTGPVKFSDAQSGVSSNRFYRALTK